MRCDELPLPRNVEHTVFSGRGGRRQQVLPKPRRHEVSVDSLRSRAIAQVRGDAGVLAPAARRRV